MGDNNHNLKKMLKIYKPTGVDWMNFVLTRRNPYTFHHIVSKSEGGEDTIRNGAILTRRAHDLLHLLEYVCPDAYGDLEDIFILINDSNEQPTKEMIEKIDKILYFVFTKQYYEFKIDIDLSEYCDLYYHQEKREKTKKIRKKH